MNFYHIPKMKIFFLSVILITATHSAFSQVGQWQWIKGATQFNAIGTYGTQGIPDPLNQPPGFYENAEWTDKNGNFWIYGGLNPMDNYNDMWKYDPVTNEWTWMNGTHTFWAPGSYGVQGVPSPTNHPPSLCFGALSWTDTVGDLWMFGGYNNGVYSDLWKYEISTNEWTWMKGPGIVNINGVPGIPTIPNTANNPWPRCETAAAWTVNNNLWMFGGQLQSWSANDLWRYDINTNTWTWMKGSIALGDSGSQSPVGVEDPANNPCSRYVYAHWKDFNGCFWIFGGRYITAAADQTLGDLWKYKPSTNNWIYMGGDNLLTNQTPAFGTQCVWQNTNWPKNRLENRAVWTDKNGNFWMYGGWNTDTLEYYSDLWKYSPSLNEWAWINGSQNPNASASGQPGAFNATNTPGSRQGAVGFRYNDSLYIFGGYDNAAHAYCSVWKFIIDDSCAQSTFVSLPFAQFNHTDSIFCEGVCVNFTNQSSNATSYQWLFPGGTPSSDTTANPQNICYSVPGSYNVTLIATSTTGSDTTIVSNAVTYNSPINFSAILQHGDTLFSVPGFYSYQWYFSGTIINGSTDYFHIAMQNGDYSVLVTDTNGCFATAFILHVITNVQSIQGADNLTIVQTEEGIRITIELTKPQNPDIMISDELGQVLYQKSARFKAGPNQIEIPLSLSAGIYFVMMKQENEMMTKKFFVGNVQLR
jgi:hypothetical protein